jgi:hypothetical protein
VILIVIVAYITFIVPKSYTPKKGKEKKSLVEMDEIDKISDQIDNDGFEKEPEPKEHMVEEDKPLPTQESLTTEEIIEEEDLDINELEDNEMDEPHEEIKADDTQDDQVETHNEKSAEDSEENQEEDKEEDKEEPVELGKYHILYREKDDKWYVKREGSDKTIRVLYTKKEAIAYATIKAINQDTNIVIHSKDGKIEKHGY